MKKLLCVLVILSACTKIPFFTRSAQQAPDEVVQAFLNLSASASDLKDKKAIQELCHGELKRIFERMSDEMFTMSYMSKGVVLKDMKVVQSMVDKDVARIRYQVKVENKQGIDPTQEMNEREVELSRVDGQWRIDSIRPVGSDQIAFSRGMVF
ncbi:MAG: hypothetical protein HYR96_12845 [Deltaproteobacteria bacterium]|nr:hypothetical protein [Deltaproteobacteria bacterium]MBI3294327.1 hypothetical protein [Deltaproteobacteria bacterium]